MKQQTNWHHIRMWLLVLGAAVIGALTYLQKIGIGGEAVTSCLAILTLIEHNYEGNTQSTE